MRPSTTRTSPIGGDRAHLQQPSTTQQLLRARGRRLKRTRAVLRQRRVTMGVLTGPYVSQLILRPETQHDKLVFCDTARRKNMLPCLMHRAAGARRE